MLFPTSVNADMRFASKGLTWMQTTKRVELLIAKECATAALGTIIKSLCGSVTEVKNVHVTISAEYLDHIDILASTIILLIWPCKSPVGAPRLFIHNDGSFRLCV